jgi:hypothetical protein
VHVKTGLCSTGKLISHPYLNITNYEGSEGYDAIKLEHIEGDKADNVLKNSYKIKHEDQIKMYDLLKTCGVSAET